MKATEIENASLWETLNIESISFERSMDTLHRKQTGSYYTSLDLTYAMMKELVSSFDDIDRNKIYTKTFLEPCVGTGNFVFAYLRVCKELGFNTEENIVLLNNIYVCDINGMALKVYERNLRKVAQEWFEISLTDDYFRKHVGCGVLFDVDAGHIEYIPITERFDLEIVDAGFDIIVTNPPIINLKAERAQ